MSDIATPSHNPSAALRQTVWITLGAIALFVGVRQLPTGTALSHTDFRVDGSGGIEFCDPSNPQFIPVVAVRSPVSLTVSAPSHPAVQGRPTSVVARLATASGKPIAPEDLLVTHTRPLHFLLLDPDLADYQHIHPEPGKAAGTWEFSFTPHRHGVYRVFADFTPAATARGLYASADLSVAPAATTATADPAQTSPSKALGGVAHDAKGEFRFSLAPASLPIRAGVVTDLRFTAARTDGRAVQLEPVMDAFAHLVAVDQNRTGFAHLHPAELGPATDSTGADAVLNFKVTIPQPGRFVVWAQVRVDGTEVYAPFWFDVVRP